MGKPTSVTYHEIFLSSRPMSMSDLIVLFRYKLTVYDSTIVHVKFSIFCEKNQIFAKNFFELTKIRMLSVNRTFCQKNGNVEKNYHNLKLDQIYCCPLVTTYFIV